MLYTLTIILITIIAVLMVIVVLLQSGQGQGLSGGIAGGGGGIGGGGNMMGARRTADFLSKATTVLATLFLTLCVLANFFIDQETVTQSTIQDRAVPVQTEQDFGTQTETPSAIPPQDQDAPPPPPPED